MTPSTTLADLKMIFVIGSVRSGTSVVGQALDRVLGGGLGFFEGNVTGLIPVVSDAVDAYYNNFSPEFLRPTAGNQISKLPKAWVKSALQQIIVGEIAKPAISNGSQVWVDKSPDGSFFANKVRACSLLATVFPKSRFVFCRRQGLENIASRMRKWKDGSFIDHCHGWAAVMAAWVKLRPELAGRYVEVDQYMIASNPDRVADDLAFTLSLTPAERDGLSKFFAAETMEQTCDARSNPARSIQQVGWSLMQKWIFLAICGGAMNRFWYDIGEVPAAHPLAPVLTLDHPTIKVEFIDFDETSPQTAKLPGGFQFNPADTSRPAPKLRFRSVPVWAETRLRGALVHGACEGAGVCYTIQITEPDRGREILTRRYTVSPGEALELNEPFYSDTEVVDLEISASIAAFGVAQQLFDEDDLALPFADPGIDDANTPLSGGLVRGGPWLRPQALARGRVVGLSCTPETAN